MDNVFEEEVIASDVVDWYNDNDNDWSPPDENNYDDHAGGNVAEEVLIAPSFRDEYAKSLKHVIELADICKYNIYYRPISCEIQKAIECNEM